MVRFAESFSFYPVKTKFSILVFLVGRHLKHRFCGQIRPKIRSRLRVSPKEYEKEGRKFYRLAAESAKEVDLAEVFWALHKNFRKAKKPLNFIAEHYLQYKKHAFFG
jgi:hypothetical protein